MPMVVYEALLANTQSIGRVKAVRRDIERAGVTVKFAPPTSAGMVLVTITLPDRYMPLQFLPGLPFYPV
jgi:hypothetical protein